MTNCLPSRRPQMSFGVTEDWLQGRLRVDEIRRRTLLDLAAAWREGEAGVMAAIDRLAEAVEGDPSPDELDQLTEAVEDVAAMDDAAVLVPMGELLRLRDELDAAIAQTAGRFNRRHLRTLPVQRDRRAS
ncbi:hypothetical protein [Streptomyces sp. WMMC897]|uniref:hypothetical protein n=1 Tax=Streptomyces sp. WMMC897 TaxID=3014782 RepID=UPI0022B7334E|nr:hypothetical protein [Streptomyces sp. WMMC897]MCZ7413104.1 hypothetical protein [Streptomyces sp. WMMC897]MCZ7413154.1 hypothetical protein [Streptomyces sp. WMMC897]MCZ7415512.1 hypothetical protein [Streptomyces sp. WMMC897]